MLLTENRISSSEKQSQCATKSHICMHVGTIATLTHNCHLAVAINGGEETEETATVCNKGTCERKKNGHEGFGAV